MHPSLRFVTHRPWPLPSGPWIMAQNWHDLLFANWPLPADVMRKLLPETLELDLYDGQAWISIVPFKMSGVRLRGTPALPWLSAFPELNVRTYVTASGKPGVWFFSLDAANPVAVELARLWFHLPYFHACMNSKSGPGGIVYASRRSDRRGERETLQASYNARGLPFEAERGTLEYFLTERYCLYAQKPDGGLLRGEIHHAPWKLQEARAALQANTMLEKWSIAISGPPVVVHYAKLQEVIAWGPKRVPD
jgi:uncharacterized protein YqjF (DUF2071 family)